MGTNRRPHYVQHTRIQPMGRKPSNHQLPPGVEVHGSKLRISFSWQGERCRESLQVTPTPATIKRAGNLRSEIKQLIDLGVFTETHYQKYFPESARFISSAGIMLFGQFAQDYLDSVEVSANTRNEYRKVLMRYWMPPLSTRDIRTVRYSELRHLVNSIEWSSAKTRNNALIPLRGIFDMAYLDEVIDSNPADRLRNLKHQKAPPDPFTRTEMELILSAMKDQLTGLDKIYASYFELAFWTGMRPSEILALKWDDIDFRSGYARVEKAQTKGRLNLQTKTARHREVALNDRAIAALKSIRHLTATSPSGCIFIAPQTQEPIASDQAPGRVWRKVLRKLGIRYRKPYNTRHTYATIHLMAGVQLSLIAKQLGNSVIMVTTVYSKWITSELDQAELSKVDSDIEKLSFAPKLSQNKKQAI